MKKTLSSLFAIVLMALSAGCSEQKATESKQPTPAQPKEEAPQKAESPPKEETIKLGKDWDYDLGKDAMTDKPEGLAYITANEAATAFVVRCDGASLSYVMALGDGQVFSMDDMMSNTIRAAFRSGEKTMLEGNFPLSSNRKGFFIDSNKEQFRSYLGDEKKLIARFDLTIPAGTHTFTFDISKLAEAEAKIKAHCGIK